MLVAHDDRSQVSDRSDVSFSRHQHQELQEATNTRARYDKGCKAPSERATTDIG